MRLNLKTLGLALVAAFAMSAFGAQAASAQDLFTSGNPEGGTFLTGTNTEGVSGVFLSQDPEGAEVICDHAQYAGTSPSNSEKEVTVHPVYSECESPGLGEANVTTDGCDYVLTGETHGGEHATAALDCTEGSRIEVEIPEVCTLSFGSQNELSGVSYDNQNEDVKDVEVTATVEGIEFTMTGELCFLVPCPRIAHPGNPHTEACETGALKEEVTVTGWKYSSAQQNETTHEWTVTETEAVDIEVSEEP